MLRIAEELFGENSDGHLASQGVNLKRWSDSRRFRCYDPLAMGDLFLTEIRRMPEVRRLRLTWDDGHVAEMDYDYLRGYCPCAGCQGHGAGDVEFKPPAQPVEPVNIRPVGNYAISVQWSDAHDTGIFRFDFLRQICPCAVCSGESGAGKEERNLEDNETSTATEREE